MLKERLAHDLGAGADAARGESYGPLLERLEQRAAELEGDNHRQRQRVLQLEAELRELTENLDAARAMNRELMNELNRGIVSEGSPRPSRAPR